MSNSIKSLIVVLLAILPVIFLAKAPLASFYARDKDWRVAAMTWVGLTVLSFLATDFWIFCVLALALLTYARRAITNPVALYPLLLLVVPPISRDISGFGLFNLLIGIDYFRLLSAAFLLPLALKIRRDDPVRGCFGNLSLDYAVIAFFILKSLIYYRYTTFPSLFRDVLGYLLDTWLPYYVLSRAFRDRESIRESMVAYILVCVALSMLAVFEAAKHWAIFNAVPYGLKVGNGGGVLLRDGIFRAQVSTGQPIVLGFAMTVAIGFWCYVQQHIAGKVWRLLTLVALLAGLFASLSRGPWLGAALMVAIYAIMAPGASRRLVQLFSGGLVFAGLLSLTPYGSKFVSYLPFVADNVDSGSAEYRSNLIRLSMEILSYYPFFGTPFYAQYMESMRTGVGIIDIVNSYLGVALPTGYVGLVVWILPFVIALVNYFLIWRRPVDTDMKKLCAVLFASMLGCLLTIGTVSPIGVIPYMLWILVGLSAGLRYVR